MTPAATGRKGRPAGKARKAAAGPTKAPKPRKARKTQGKAAAPSGGSELALPPAVPGGVEPAKPKALRLPFARHFAQRLKETEQGHLFLAGLAMLLALIVEVVLLLVFVPSYRVPILQGVIADTFSGKEGALGIYVTSGVPWWLAGQISSLQHLATGTLAFPLFLFLLHRYHDRDNLVMRRLRRIERAAGEHQAYVNRWGPIGLFLFMMVPFLVNGPLVGAILGRLCGIPVRRLIGPVVLATLVSSAMWAYFYKQLTTFGEQLDKRLPLMLALAVVALALGLALVDEYRERRRERELRAAGGDGSAPPSKP